MHIRKQETRGQGEEQVTLSTFPGKSKNIENFKAIESSTHKELKYKNITLIENTLIEQQDFNTHCEISSTMISFWFCLSGAAQMHIQGSRNEIEIDYYKGNCGLFIGQEGSKGISRVSSRTPFRFVAIHLDNASLVNILDEEYQQLPRTFRLSLEGQGSGCLRRIMQQPPMIKAALEQMLSCSLKKNFKRLYLEGKTMEIIACMLEYLQIGAPPDHTLSALELDRIYHAEDLLIHRILDPPSLTDLARSVGIHHTKLNKGFKAVFNNTVFGRLQEIRLEKARHYLETGDMNCAEAAFSVGYSSPAHFSTAFKKQYGTNPKHFIKTIYR